MDVASGKCMQLVLHFRIATEISASIHVVKSACNVENEMIIRIGGGDVYDYIAGYMH